MAAPLPSLSLHEGTDRSSIKPGEVVEQWLATLERLLQSGQISDAASSLFLEHESLWRDNLALTFDRRTKQGEASILDFLQHSAHKLGSFNAVSHGSLAPTLVDMGGMIFIQAGFTFQNTFGSGTGLLRLVNVGPHEWKAWLVYTQLEKLKEKPTVKSTHDENDLQVLVVGAGHSGLMLAAWLQNLGIRYCVVEKHARIGDSWRNRYRSIKLHTPSWIDHYPFLSFPPEQDEFLDQARISDWQEHYAATLDLRIELKTTVKKAGWNQAAGRYTVEVEGPQGPRLLAPKHLVLATGLFSSTPKPTPFKEESAFNGQLYHSVQHTSGEDIENVTQKDVVVIGPGTSGHDVALDFVNSGAKSVSLVQRSPIFSFTAKAITTIMMGVFKTPGVSTYEADLILNSFPTPVIRAMSPFQTQAMAAFDKELLDGMEAQGLGLLRGENGYGFAEYQFLKGGHFYVDQGASQKIVDGQIKIVRDKDGATGLYEGGVVLGSGDRVSADVVVLATGFEPGETAVERLLGPHVRQQVGELWNLDSEGEFRGWWRPTGYPGLWFFPSNFMWGRTFSQSIALQIKAVEDGYNVDYWKENVCR